MNFMLAGLGCLLGAADDEGVVEGVCYRVPATGWVTDSDTHETLRKRHDKH